MPFIDPRSALGLARQAGARILRSAPVLRQVSIDFLAKSLLYNSSCARPDRSEFNVGLVTLGKVAARQPACLGFESERLRLGHAGASRLLSLSQTPIRRFGENGGYENQEWCVSCEEVSVGRRATARVWDVPILFHNHLVTRMIERGVPHAEVFQQFQSILALGNAWLDFAHARAGRLFCFSVIIPVRGGVLCGGIDLVRCDRLSACFTVTPDRPTIHMNLRDEPLVPVVSLRTYMDDGLLDPHQRALAASLHAWKRPGPDLAWHETLGFPLGSVPGGLHLGTEFEDLCRKVQTAFPAWEARLRNAGYDQLDLASLEADPVNHHARLTRPGMMEFLLMRGGTFGVTWLREREGRLSMPVGPGAPVAVKALNLEVPPSFAVPPLKDRPLIFGFPGSALSVPNPGPGPRIPRGAGTSPNLPRSGLKPGG